MHTRLNKEDDQRSECQKIQSNCNPESDEERCLFRLVPECALSHQGTWPAAKEGQHQQGFLWRPALPFAGSALVNPIGCESEAAQARVPEG